MLRDHFPPHVIKDLVISALFLVFIYAITHNPYMYPRPLPEAGNWSIQKLQHPLFFGLAGHNYVVLKDAEGTIISELHGLATDRESNAWKYIGTNESDILKVWQFEGPRYYLAEKNFPGLIIAEGDKDQMEILWALALACKESINAKNISYPPYGFRLQDETDNSNSVAYTLSLCMGLDARHLGLFTPGARNNLLRELTQ